ncbi:excinuclease ABC subunit UvrC [Anaerotalea alkaliphila]|uniref:UvrABC system protein C n=1 Tax=Anaerotalea alkaliphila TaxID=2662126 RepID=A0A7X5HV50_9FIRM|nr:excinuclease ABC subunit UvrC [Anaerotalea alkaliphila]NDL67220.1 excinuclease ABC subunit UvrC [Anaerotalea alkaliphila]
MWDLKEALKTLPDRPGVYLMKDAQDQVIYVGKAKVLKNRVRQYFQSTDRHSPKIAQMVRMVREFEYIVTDSELEALILELNLIKKYRPKYNTLLKDDKTYPYIKITVQEAYPRILYTRQVRKDKAKYYGPYSNATAAKGTIDLLHKICRIRSCDRRLPQDIGKERPCLYYHIHQCDAPCQGWITQEAYGEKVAQAVAFMGGKHQPVVEALTQEMRKAAENLDFEKAAKVRDQLSAVSAIMEKQKIVHAAMEDQDVVAFAREEGEALVQVYFIRNGKMVGREHFRMEHVEGQSGQDIVTAFVKQFYSGTPYIPKELVLQEDMDEAAVIQQWLSDRRGQKVHIKVPRKGEKSKLVELAAQNAAITLRQFGEQMRRKEQRTRGALEEILQAAGLDKDARRLEAYDISNSQGFESVGSMVVFEDGEPKRSDYRKFKIKSVQGPNDYASLEEVLRRRFSHAFQEQREILEKGMDARYGSFTRLPDLILMDGGKGQVNIAQGVLEAMELSIPVCGMVKDDQHRTRGLYCGNREVPLDPRSEGFKLLARIQDEAHRFAIEYHRKLRGKTQVRSVLDDIPGVGPTRRKALLKEFGSVEGIRNASLEALAAAPGMNRKAAAQVREFFGPVEK